MASKNLSSYDQVWLDTSDPDENGCMHYSKWPKTFITKKGKKRQKVPYIRINGILVSLLREVYVNSHGEPPPGVPIRRICNSKDCIAPEHIILFTPKNAKVKEMTEYGEDDKEYE